MPVQIEHVQADLNLQPQGATEPGSARTTAAGLNGINRAEVERLRPMVLLILREELDRLRRQQG
jgi:hypothetical protein